MRIHLEVAENDLTKYIVEDSYDINTTDKYEAWEDGNMVEHRIVVTSKVSGSFEILCSNHSNTISLARFLELWNSVTVNKVATIGVYVPIINEFKAIECYFSMESSKHILEPNGDFVDVIKVKIQER